MELLIEIPEELKNKIDNANENNYRTYLWWFETTLYCAIKNGIPLPKGHGDLKDVSDLLTVTDIRSDGSEFTYVPYSEIEDALTIIEADKAESEDGYEMS